MYRKMLLVSLLLALTLSACGSALTNMSNVPPDGQVYALQLRSTLWGMQQAAQGAQGTALVQSKDGNLLMFVWQIKNAWGFATINLTSKAPVENLQQLVGGGNFVSPRTVSDLISTLRTNGWETISPAGIPPAVKVALSGGSSWLTGLASSMTTFLVIPASEFTTPDFLREYQEAVEGIDS